MTHKELEILKEKLPPKAIKKLSENTGYAYETVRLVLGGHRNNEIIIDAAIELAAKYQIAQKVRTKKIKAL